MPKRAIIAGITGPDDFYLAELLLEENGVEAASEPLSGSPSSAGTQAGW